MEALAIIIAGTFTYFGQSKYFANNIVIKYTTITEEQVIIFKEWLLIIGIIALVLHSTITIMCLRNKLNKCNNQRLSLLKEMKEMLFITLDSILEQKSTNLKLRVFKPRKKISLLCKSEGKLKIKFQRKIFLYITHIEGLTDILGVEKLRFEVYPKQQGLVGTCYTTRNPAYDEYLSETNSKQYNLSKFHESKTNDFQFCVCI